jgi:hypothetical protein
MPTLPLVSPSILRRHPFPFRTLTRVGHMAEANTTPKKRLKKADPAQFERFIEAARKRGLDESLEDFAARFRKIVPRKAATMRPD